MFCTKCGADIAPGIKFCTKCGAPAPTGAAAKPAAKPEKPQPKSESKSEPPKPAEKKKVAEVQPRPVGGRPKVGLILVIVGVVILVVVGLLIFKPWSKEEEGSADGGDGVTPGVSKPAGVNFKIFENDLTEATGVPSKFHIEYPDWTIEETGQMTGSNILLSVQTKNECWLEVSPEGGEADTIEEAWQNVEESVQTEMFENIDIIKVELDKAKMEGVIEFDDPTGKIVSGQPIHLLSKFVYVEVQGEGVGAIAVLFYAKPDKWSEYEDIAEYVISSAKIIKGPVLEVKVPTEIQRAQDNAYIKARDARRLSDISQFRTALEMYYLDHDDTYPDSLDSLREDYMRLIPSNPSPRTDGGCPDRDYIYQSQDDGQSYTIKYCLGVGAGDISDGEHQLTPGGIANP
jgi:hypothetical protein